MIISEIGSYLQADNQAATVDLISGNTAYGRCMIGGVETPMQWTASTGEAFGGASSIELVSPTPKAIVVPVDIIDNTANVVSPALDPSTVAAAAQVLLTWDRSQRVPAVTLTSSEWSELLDIWNTSSKDWGGASAVVSQALVIVRDRFLSDV